MLKHAQVVPIVDSMSTVDDQGIPVVEVTHDRVGSGVDMQMRGESFDP